MRVQILLQRIRRSVILAAALAVAAASLLVVVSPAPASATETSVVGGWYALSWDPKPKLFRIDKSTGEAVLIATATENVGTNGVAAFDVDGTTGIGYLFTYDNNVAQLWSVDLRSGVFTKIGNVTGVEKVVAFDIAIDGSFWIYADRTNPQLQPGFGTVDRTTAAFTRLGDGPERLSAFASDVNGELVGIGYSWKVYRFNRSADTWVTIGELPSEVLAADFDADGTLLAQGWAGELDRIDVTAEPPTVTRLFTFSGADWPQGGEAFAVAGPSDGRTLAQALGLAPMPGGDEPSSSGSLSLSCEGRISTGAQVTCRVSGGDPGIDILWQAAFNPVFASAGVTLDAAGAGTFSFTIPAAALGQNVTVELVEWLAPAPLGVVGGPVPASLPAGEGPAVPAGLVALALLAAVGGVAVRRQAVTG